MFMGWQMTVAATAPPQGTLGLPVYVPGAQGPVSLLLWSPQLIKCVLQCFLAKVAYITGRESLPSGLEVITIRSLQKVATDPAGHSVESLCWGSHGPRAMDVERQTVLSPADVIWKSSSTPSSSVTLGNSLTGL